LPADGKGGGFDQGSDLDFREIPTGKQICANVLFNIISPEDNNGKSMIVLKGRKISYFPEEVKAIPVNEKVKNLYFLQCISMVFRRKVCVYNKLRRWNKR